jgi:hypothetical protein
MESRPNQLGGAGICEPSRYADLSISTSWPSLCWANATVTTASVDAPADKVEAQLRIPGPSQAGRHGVGYLQRPVIESDCRQRKTLLSSVFCSAIWPRGVPRWFRRTWAVALAHAGCCGPCWDQQIARLSGRLCVWHDRVGRSADAIQPSLTTLTRSAEQRHGPLQKTVDSYLHRLPM